MARIHERSSVVVAAVGAALACALLLALDLPSAAGNQVPNSLERLATAKTAPCSLAQRVYSDLLADTGAADSVRMMAAGLKADACYASGDFRCARDFYAQAVRYDANRSAVFLHRAGLAAIKAGDTAQALSFFSQSAGMNDSDYSNRSRVMLGNCALASADYERAMKLFQETGSFSAKNSWSVPAFIGKLTCAKYLGLADSAAVYDRLLSLYAKSMLEKERYIQAKELPLQRPGKQAARRESAPEPKRTLNAGDATDTFTEDTTFTLQVGAFGSKYRAQELTGALSKKFKGVTCMPAIVSDRTFYRVWIGSFASRELAETFGKNRLAGLGQEYRIVVRQ
jgi:tetratricopeptide (TPR) repeat protein